MNTKLMTVVVPVYKVEQYIDKCLDSLILPEGWMDRLEVLVVNDGTPDRSAEMAREYEVRYPGTFRVIDKPNGGHGSAWNRGLPTGFYTDMFNEYWTKAGAQNKPKNVEKIEGACYW